MMEINLSQAKHFSFDLWLTLIASNPKFKPKRDQLFKDFFSIEKSIEDVGKVLRQFDILANKISEITGVHFDANQIYCLALKELKVDIEKISSEELNLFQYEVEHLFIQNKPMLIDPNIKNLFQKIRNQNKTMSLLSNTAFIRGKQLKNVLQDYDLSSYFEFQIYSDEIGFSKPNKEVFDVLFKEINKIKTIKKNEIMHIGDNKIADYNGAIDYGFKAILI
ncbi:HAD family hydrolase [Sphingobacterium mizutaii]|uniref:HAD family hydrolase n=1 Tax=Sphingobacterium mizutaii TaxID=1010 RepID=UPI0028A8BD92|nr:HAD family hydrolase [Sphingobacterium mizutaii]